ncbi:MAG TPA: TraB/GumN family protein [Steroidobacteraceae bacterium]|nr:TraB/GumN family protein [Steroidobacteraceae bacterium]
MRFVLLAFLGAWVFSGALAADEDANSVVLDEVFVTGTFPGPGLWRVSHPDHGRILWIIARPPLLPPGMHWQSEEIEQVAAQSQLIVFGDSFGIVPDGKFGIWRMLTLAPSMLGVRKNPNGERLQELLPPESYARWREQKLRILGNDRGIEKWRPMFAGEKLRQKAVKAFNEAEIVKDPHDAEPVPLWTKLTRIAKEKGIRTASSTVTVKIPPKEMRMTVKRFAAGSVNDLECFDQTVYFVAALADVQSIRARARAWAIGDLETLRRIPSLPSFQNTCTAAILQSEAAAPYWRGDLQERLSASWLKTIEESLDVNDSTLAVLPIDELLSSTGRLADLRNKGYVVQEP